MNTLLNTIFWTAIWVIPFLILGIILSVYFFTRYWQSQSRKWLASSRSTLRKMELEGERARQSIQDYYSIDDPEPFASKITRVNEKLFLLEKNIASFREEYLAIHQSMKDIRLRRFGDFLQTPFKWHQVFEKVRHLQWNESQFQELLHQADEELQSIKRLGLEVAAKAQDIHADYQKIKTFFENLASSSMRGDSFMGTRAQMDLLQQSIQNIPLVFLTGSDDEILSLTDKAMIINTYDTLQQIKPLIKQHSGQLSTWDHQYQNAAREFQQLQLASGKLEKMIESLPVEIRPDITTTTFNKLMAFIEHTRDTLNHPTPGDLTSIARKSRQMKRTAEDLEKKYAHVFQQLQSLHEAVVKLGEDTDRLQSRYLTLEKNPLSSLTWDETSSRLDHLRLQVDNLGQATPGSLSSIKEYMKTVASLNANLDELEQHFHLIEGQFIQYLALLEKLEPKKFREWTMETVQFSSEVQEYSQANWTNAQDLDFINEVKTLEDDLIRWYPKDLSAPIQESILPQRLAQGLRIDALQQVLTDQMTGVRKRLEEVRDLENKSLEDLRHARQELDSISSLAQENPSMPLLEPAKIASLQREIDNLIDKFENRQRGSVDDKANKTGQLLKQTGRYFYAQLEHMQKQLDQQREEIKKIIDHLDSIARIDSTQINEAGQLAAREVWQASEPDEIDTTTIEEMRTTLETLSQEYLDQAELMDELQKMKQQLDESFKAFTEQQHSARYLIESTDAAEQQLNASMASARELAKARQEFNRLENEWSLTRQQLLPLETLITKLNGFKESYQKFNKYLDEINNKLGAERSLIQDILAELDMLTRNWEGLQREYLGNRMAQRQIQDLLNSVKRERLSLWRQYKGGRLNIDQYVKSLDDLLQTVKDALISLDDQRKINIHGDLIEG